MNLPKATAPVVRSGLEDASDAIVTRYRKREIGPSELRLIRAKIEEHGSRPRTRKAIATALCEEWDWRQPRGSLAVRACGDLLLRLQDWGYIKLPPTREGTSPRRSHLPLLPHDLIPLAGIEVQGPSVDLSSLVVRPITPGEFEGWKLYMGRYHYLGSRAIPGEHLLYAAFLGEELVALLAWGSAALQAPLREEYIGWDERTKFERLRFVADNVRFLVLPWVRVPHLASKILGANLRRLSRDWERVWGHPIYLAETFVDTSRFRGTCYRAANWIHLGQTAGRSKRGNKYSRAKTTKALFVYPLHRRARQLLGEGERAQEIALALVPTGENASPGTELPSSIVAVRSPLVPLTGAPAPTDALAEHASLPVVQLSAMPHTPGAGAEHPEHRSGLLTLTAALTALAPDGGGSSPQPSVPSGPAVLERSTRVDTGAAVEELERRSKRATSQAPELRGSRLQIELTETEREALERQARGLAIPHRIVVRSKIILLLAAGGRPGAIAQTLRTPRCVVRKWAQRFVKKRLDGLVDAERSGRPPRFSPRSSDSHRQAGLRTAR